MPRYSGLLVNLRYFFLHYFMLSDPLAFIALVSGVVITVLFLILLFMRPDKKFLNALAFIALAPLFIGIAGTISTVHSTREAIKIENLNGKSPSAKKYYSLEYIYSQTLLQAFPALAGAAGSIAPVILLAALKRRIIVKNE
ncbi:MAG: hypothetical protein PHV48_01365 [Candidatus Omnitrophica bacterium]|nr:hypothetical protein [Candidatus Omnitrophota bacterium]